MLIVIGILLFFYLLIKYSSSKANLKLKKEKDAFWLKEYQANSTRKSDISNLDYITVPMDSLPFAETEEDELKSIQNSIKNLSLQPILNLTGLSNTDLKLKYGVGNIAFLIQCDNNYTLLIQNIYKWGAYLYEHNNLNEAVLVLEFGIKCRTDISKNYIILAELYQNMNVPEKIEDLIQASEGLNTLSRETILTALKEIKISYYLI
ncbi:MAG: hypothetical protein WCD89_13890 [Anaerocolumna sp.]